MDKCQAGKGWISQGRALAPTPAPGPSEGNCTDPECQVDLDDSKWRLLNLPHDFVVEGTFSSSNDCSHGFLPYSQGWYRRHFTIPKAMQGQAIWIDFDGTQRDSDVYLNGVKLGHHDSGYTPYRFAVGQCSGRDDVPLHYDGDNVLAVHVDATQPDGWWYDGGGIYRDVWLNSADPLHIAPWGLYVPTIIDKSSIKNLDEGLSTAAASVVAVVTVTNNGNTERQFSLKASVTPADTTSNTGTAANTSSNTGTAISSLVQDLVLAANTTADFNITLDTGTVALWSVESPKLYQFACQVVADSGVVVDQDSTTFGFRTLQFDADNGLFVNGKQVKIQGMANHQDFAGVGVAVPDSLQAYRVWKMKQMGANGWRTAHNPPNPALLDETDRQGMLVWDENHRNRIGEPWESDLKALIHRDRNHPSVILWSICNEVLCENFNADNAKVLKKIVKESDPMGGRPVTAAMNGGYSDPFALVLDVTGINYNIGEYDSFHKAHPTQPMIGSETSSDVSDRGIYKNDPEKAYVEAYDTQYPGWGNTAEDAWCAISSRKYIEGGFVWTGFDYKGEPTPYQWPNINSHFGNIDIAGFPKDNYYYYQSQTGGKAMAHLFPHWNWGVGDKVDMWVYTTGTAAELFVNGKSQGKQAMSDPCRHIVWKAVPWASGNVTSVVYDSNGNVHAVAERITSGAPHAVALTLEWPLANALHADDSDTALVTATIVDAFGREVPTAMNSIGFTLDQTSARYSRILGLGNGDPSSHETDYPLSPVNGSRSAFNGLARVLVQATTAPGAFTITATSAGLQSGSLTFKSSFSAFEKHP